MATHGYLCICFDRFITKNCAHPPTATRASFDVVLGEVSEYTPQAFSTQARYRSITQERRWELCDLICLFLIKIAAFKKMIVNITQIIRIAVMHEWLVEFGKASSHNCCSVLSPSPRERSAPQNNLKVTAVSLVPKHSDDIFVN